MLQVLYLVQDHHIYSDAEYRSDEIMLIILLFIHFIILHI